MSEKKVWDKIAEGWNNFRQRPEKKAIELSKLWKKGKILDVGCGNCRNLKPFVKLDKYGIDFSDNMIEEAKKFTKKNNFKVNLKVGNVKKLPFKDKQFDYVLSLAMLHHLKDPEKGVKEINRVLKVGGQSYITIWSKLQLKFLFKKRETYVKWGKEKRYYNFISFIKMRKMLKKSGFRILRSKLFGKNLEFLVEKINI
jgi:tRNA (uracil-5-)-methyltransferase TRM9